VTVLKIKIQLSLQTVCYNTVQDAVISIVSWLCIIAFAAVDAAAED
jgi:hypothetical protein